MQHHLLRNVAEVHAVHDDVALQPHIVDASVRLVLVLPGPHAGPLLCLGERPVRVLPGVHQGDVSVVRLRLQIHQAVDPVRACRRHGDRIHLHGDLGEGAVEVPVQCQEGHQDADGHAEASGDREGRAQHRHDHIVQIPELHHDGHQDVRHGVRLVAGSPELFVLSAELRDALFFVRKDLDHLLSAHHLLDVPVHLSQVSLLQPEEPPGLGSDLSGGEQDPEGHAHGDQRQRNVQDAHADEDAGDAADGVDELREGLSDELPQRVRVIGVDRHDVAVGVRVKITDGKLFHVGKQIFPDAPHGPLSHLHHQPVVGESGKGAHQIDESHGPERPEERSEIRVGCLCHGYDIVVDQSPEEQCPAHVRHRRHSDEKHYRQKRSAVHSEDHPDHTVQVSGSRGLHRLGYRHVAPSLRSSATCHLRPPFPARDRNRRRSPPGLPPHCGRSRWSSEAPHESRSR